MSIQNLPLVLPIQVPQDVHEPFVDSPAHVAAESPEIEAMRNIYLGLGEYKWMECIDAVHRDHGSLAYDLGLHGGKVEPGYIQSMTNLFHFLQCHLTSEITADFYLEAHKIACAHFRNHGAGSFTHCSEEKVGRFRGLEDHIHWITNSMSEGAISEFEALGLGRFDRATSQLEYTNFFSGEVRALFTGYVEEYNANISSAETRDQKLRAIARFFQKIEWLHAPVDGCGRTDTAILNFLLVQNGFHPVLLDDPYVSSKVDFEHWVSHLLNGLENWDIKRSQIQAEGAERRREREEMRLFGLGMNLSWQLEENLCPAEFDLPFQALPSVPFSD